MSDSWRLEDTYFNIIQFYMEISHTLGRIRGHSKPHLHVPSVSRYVLTCSKQNNKDPLGLKKNKKMEEICINQQPILLKILHIPYKQQCREINVNNRNSSLSCNNSYSIENVHVICHLNNIPNFSFRRRMQNLVFQNYTIAILGITGYQHVY